MHSLGPIVNVLRLAYLAFLRWRHQALSERHLLVQIAPCALHRPKSNRSAMASQSPRLAFDKLVSQVWAFILPEPPHPMSTINTARCSQLPLSPMNPPSGRIRKRRAPQRQLPDPHQIVSGRHEVFIIGEILMSHSVAETKLPDTIKAALCNNATYLKILLQISKPSRATAN